MHAITTNVVTSIDLNKMCINLGKNNKKINLSEKKVLIEMLANPGKTYSGDEIGKISEGLYADLVVINLKSTQEIEQRAEKATNFWEEVFPTLIMGDDRAIETTWVSGKEAFK